MSESKDFGTDNFDNYSNVYMQRCEALLEGNVSEHIRKEGIYLKHKDTFKFCLMLGFENKISQNIKNELNNYSKK